MSRRNVSYFVLGALVGTFAAQIVSPMISGNSPLSWNLLFKILSNDFQTVWVALGVLASIFVVLAAVEPLRQAAKERRERVGKIRLATISALADTLSFIIMIHCRHSDVFGATLQSPRGLSIRHRLDGLRDQWMLLTEREIGFLLGSTSLLGLVADMADPPKPDAATRYDTLYLKLLEAGNSVNHASGAPEALPMNISLSGAVMKANELAAAIGRSEEQASGT